MKDSGHHLLVTDGEEHGQIGAKWLVNYNPDIAEILHKSSFMVQFDRRHGSDYKFYNIPVSDEFEDFIEHSTGYTNAGKRAFTDIVTLCNNSESCCGVNLSVGYYDEHTSYETLNIAEWTNTLNVTEQMLANPLPRFPLAD
ncbi:MAG: hypothetical protein ACK4UP_11130 [Spirosomataceae bacterium]